MSNVVLCFQSNYLILPVIVQFLKGNVIKVRTKAEITLWTQHCGSSFLACRVFKPFFFYSILNYWRFFSTSCYLKPFFTFPPLFECRWGAGGQSQPEWSYRAGGWDAVRPHPRTLHPDKPRHCADGMPPAKHTVEPVLLLPFVPFDRLHSHLLPRHWYRVYWKYSCLAFASYLFKSCSVREQLHFWRVCSDVSIAVGEIPAGRFWLLPPCVLWKPANASNRWVNNSQRWTKKAFELWPRVTSEPIITRASSSFALSFAYICKGVFNSLLLCKCLFKFSSKLARM